MPLILAEPVYDLMLAPAVKDPARLRPFLVPYPAGEIETCPVGILVNSHDNGVE